MASHISYMMYCTGTEPLAFRQQDPTVNEKTSAITHDRNPSRSGWPPIYRTSITRTFKLWCSIPMVPSAEDGSCILGICQHLLRSAQAGMSLIFLFAEPRRKADRRDFDRRGCESKYHFWVPGSQPRATADCQPESCWIAGLRNSRYNKLKLEYEQTCRGSATFRSDVYRLSIRYLFLPPSALEALSLEGTRGTPRASSRTSS